MAIAKFTPPRILLAKVGLDGHDRGVKVLARCFRDAGIEVIYTGLWQTPEATMYAALQEDVDVVGISLHSAAHLSVMREMARLRSELKLDGLPLVLGGIVPVGDYEELEKIGVAAVFNPGSPVEAIIDKIRSLTAERQAYPFTEVTEGYAARDDHALARLISRLQRSGGFGDEGFDGWSPPEGNARVIGVTGAPGVGKSSFIGRLAAVLQQRGKQVGVVAIDPSSPVTGGALLGDRLRMMTGTPNRDLFIRSLSSGSVQGGLGPRVAEVVKLLSGFGFDYVLVETVGAGQSDVTIRELASTVVLLLMPESGDAIQFSKAGIMEIASCFVLNKCDLAGADASVAQLQSAVGDRAPLFKVSTVRDQGIESVAQWLLSLPQE